MNLTVDLNSDTDIKASITFLQRLLGVDTTKIKMTVDDKPVETINSGTLSMNPVEITDKPKPKTSPEKNGPDPKATEADTPEITKEMVQKRMKTMLEEKKRAEMIEALSEFGVKKLSEMTANAYPEFYAKMGELM
ncbi:hypothetical protein [Loigolactobacillus zhaoyuanensis]|uniref:Uncharacterized protein n=1 Tax=Loigolactobacillus zhaoyuanensis TaxID=2486017 RepID=A0ABW8UBC2_9LACO